MTPNSVAPVATCCGPDSEVVTGLLTPVNCTGKVTIAYELNALADDQLPGPTRHEGAAFNLPLGKQSRSGFRQKRVGVPRVAHQFAGAFRQAAHDLFKFLHIEP